MSLLGQPLGPRALSREGRVELLLELADALLRGDHASREAELFAGTAIRAWLKGGGSLTGRYLDVDGIPGSHRTAAWVARNLSSSRGQHDATDLATLEPSESPTE